MTKPLDDPIASPSARHTATVGRPPSQYPMSALCVAGRLRVDTRLVADRRPEDRSKIRCLQEIRLVTVVGRRLIGDNDAAYRAKAR